MWPHHGARRPSSNASPLLFHYRPIIIALATDPPVFSTTPWQGTVERWQFASPFAKNLGSACADAPRYLEHCGRTAANSSIGIVMSGRRPLIKGFFAALRLIVGASATNNPRLAAWPSGMTFRSNARARRHHSVTVGGIIQESRAARPLPATSG